MPLGQLAPDMPEFLEIDRARALGDLGLEGGVAARAAAARLVIAALLFLGQVEQIGGLRPGAVDQPLVDAVIGDDREAEPLERPAERRGEAFGIGRLLCERQRGDLGGGRSFLSPPF